jgi:large subunit ribosomal protein L13
MPVAARLTTVFAFRFPESSRPMTTYMAKPGTFEQKWLLVDATDKIVGRLASEIADILMGKHRPTYTPHVDTGDFVVVVNCEKIKFTGNKCENKPYAWYTGYTGQRTITAEDRLARRPELILQEAVRRMLPKNKLGAAMLSKLKIYAGANHPHQAQQPEPTELASAS